MDLTTGMPLWLIKNGLPFNYPALLENIKTDVLIIGGGISGALTAYTLMEAGISCVVVDQRSIGLGSTCSSTSLLQYELDTPLSKLSKQIGEKSASRAYQLCSEAINDLADISEKLKFSQFERHKSLYFAAFKKDISLIEAEYKYRKEAGFDLELLSSEDIKSRFGFYAPAGILSAQGATTDAYIFTHHLLQHALKNGAKVFDRTEIVHIDYEKSGVKLKTASGHIVSAQQIVNASGYEIKEFIDKKIVKLSSTYAIASEHNVKDQIPWKDKSLLWNTADPYLYMRLTPDNRIIIGGRDEDFYNPTKRDKLIKSKSLALKRDFEKLFPDYHFKTEFSWTGTFGSTKDSLPYIGNYDKTPHTYYALGFGGNGITFSIIAAQIIRDLVQGKKNKDAQLFSFSRG